MDIKEVSKIVFAPITVDDLHYWCPPDPARRDVVDAINDYQRNNANYGISWSDNATSK